MKMPFVSHSSLSGELYPTCPKSTGRRLSSWKGKLLSVGGRLVLINSVLTNMVLYMLSFFQLPKGVLQRLDYFRSRFFWQGDGE